MEVGESLRIPEGPGGERRTGGIPEEAYPFNWFHCFSSFNHIFAHSLLLNLYPPRDFCGVLVFNHRTHSALFVFILPAPTPSAPYCVS